MIYFHFFSEIFIYLFLFFFLVLFSCATTTGTWAMGLGSNELASAKFLASNLWHTWVQAERGKGENGPGWKYLTEIIMVVSKHLIGTIPVT